MENPSSANSLEVKSPSTESPASEQPPTDTSNSNKANHESKERKKPYVNPERVNTGGTQRDKLSEEELAERMGRIRQQNEKIKQRRLDVQADEDAFKKTQEVEKAKQARNRKVQESVDNAREQNAKRKMDKVQSREWDSGKPASDWKAKGQNPPSKQQTSESAGKEDGEADESSASQNDSPSGQWTRGAPRGFNRGRVRGRGRGRGGANSRGVAKNEGSPTIERSAPPETKAAANAEQAATS
ncbi:hypothetical protein D9758_001776 [Tetrapyrgos nigripes]|uniref:Uncharacterized protein n=1 Tax=Tetrapyrgos nigripes TaxID=182062 RepID=A0A8H5LX02_9AGAR|nr:hypothetical protein D9758_001776 [Tetrapyrgos nigripes]